HRLTFSAEGDVALAARVARWQPWEPISQSLRTPRNELVDPHLRAEHVRRSYLLSQRGFYAYAHGVEILAQGRFDEARALAELTENDLLRMDILVSEGRYAEVLAKAPGLLKGLEASDATASLAFRLAHDGARASMTLERAPDFVSDVVDRWVIAEPPHVVD